MGKGASIRARRFLRMSTITPVPRGDARPTPKASFYRFRSNSLIFSRFCKVSGLVEVLLNVGKRFSDIGLLQPDIGLVGSGMGRLQSGSGMIPSESGKIARGMGKEHSDTGRCHSGSGKAFRRWFRAGQRKDRIARLAGTLAPTVKDFGRRWRNWKTGRSWTAAVLLPLSGHEKAPEGRRTPRRYRAVHPQNQRHRRGLFVEPQIFNHILPHCGIDPRPGRDTGN